MALRSRIAALVVAAILVAAGASAVAATVLADDAYAWTLIFLDSH